MSEKIVQLNEEIIKGQLKELVRGSVEETLNELLENGRRISAFAAQLPFMRGTALTPGPGIKNRQAPCGACRFLVRVVGLEPTRLAAQEPKSCVSTNSTIPAYEVLRACTGDKNLR